MVVLRTSHGTWTLVTTKEMTDNVRKTQTSNCGALVGNKTADMKQMSDSAWGPQMYIPIQSLSPMREVREWGTERWSHLPTVTCSQWEARQGPTPGYFTLESAGVQTTHTAPQVVHFCRWLPHSWDNWSRVPYLRTQSYVVSCFPHVSCI